MRPSHASSLRGANGSGPKVAGPMTTSATKQSSGAMNARFVDLDNETAALDCFAPLAMTTKEKRKRNADRRVQPTSASRDAARTSGCARLSAFHYGSYRQGFRPLGATPGQASWDVAGRSIRYGRPNRGAKILRSYAGVTRARLSQSRECTSRTGHSAGQHDARSCRGAECIVPPAGTALAPPPGIPSRQASSVSEILFL
jgi:hypothetical protein